MILGNSILGMAAFLAYNGMITGRGYTDKELARQYRSRKFYIVKLIDRDNEEDGVKFWRFKHNWKGDGPIDKIIPIWRNKGDVTDINEGRDLILILQAVPLPGGRGEYTTVSSVMYEDPGKLTEDSAQGLEWTSDEKTWKDVFFVSFRIDAC